MRARDLEDLNPCKEPIKLSILPCFGHITKLITTIHAIIFHEDEDKPIKIVYACLLISMYTFTIQKLLS